MLQNLQQISSVDELQIALKRMPPVFSAREHPYLFSLCSCIGIQHEIASSMDRLSPYLAFDLERNNKDITAGIAFSHEQFYLELTRPSQKLFTPRSAELAKFLSVESQLSESGLSKIVLHPLRIAIQMAELGFELVIVRDWILELSLIHI